MDEAQKVVEEAVENIERIRPRVNFILKEKLQKPRNILIADQARIGDPRQPGGLSVEENEEGPGNFAYYYGDLAG